jgi:hypothetical protein
MRLTLFCLLLLSYCSLSAQVTYEEKEYSGIVAAIEPGNTFNLSQLVLNVDGREEPLVFNPIYGKLLVDKLKVGTKITIKANVNHKARERYYAADIKLRGFIRNFIQDVITEISIGNELFKLKPLVPQAYSKERIGKPKVFIDRKVIDFYSEGNFKRGIIFDDGFVAFNKSIDVYYDPCRDMKIGDSVSFTGFKLETFEGGKYPVEGVKKVYTLGFLNKSYGRVESFLFKQNEVCIGVKFSTKSGKELKLSFPSDRAEKVKKFLKPGVDLKIYHGRLYDITNLDLPELQAIIQNKDTLYIEEFGFFGGADVDHDHTPIELKGKITRINKTACGGIMNIIVNHEYYVEIEAMMAQQLGSLFKRGQEISVAGKVRIKKQGEIYKKDYKIVTPEKVVVDGKMFSINQP